MIDSREACGLSAKKCDGAKQVQAARTTRHQRSISKGQRSIDEEALIEKVQRSEMENTCCSHENKPIESESREWNKLYSSESVVTLRKEGA
jgi:hypothetical protein